MKIDERTLGLIELSQKHLKDVVEEFISIKNSPSISEFTVAVNKKNIYWALGRVEETLFNLQIAKKRLDAFSEEECSAGEEMKLSTARVTLACCHGGTLQVFCSIKSMEFYLGCGMFCHANVPDVLKLIQNGNNALQWATVCVGFLNEINEKVEG